MKRDNAPIHYKNLYGFKSMQNLPDKYNFRIIRICEAAGHDKGLIDAMSSFVATAILRRDIVTKDIWFQKYVNILSLAVTVV